MIVIAETPYKCLHMPAISLSQLRGPTQVWPCSQELPLKYVQLSTKAMVIKFQFLRPVPSQNCLRNQKCYYLSLRLKTNPQQVHEAKYSPPTNGTYSHTGFHNSQASYLNMKVLVFAESGYIQFFLNHC